MKWAIVTGSSSGLGLAITKYLLEEGYSVAGGSRSGTEIEHPNFYDMELDVTQEEAVSEFYETLAPLTKKIDLFVNNAGICDFLPLSETSVGHFQDHWATNTLGPMMMLKALYPYLVKNHTQIVSLLSTAAKTGFPHASSYTSSKFGELGMLESVKQEWKELGVKFTHLFSGAVDTPLWEAILKAEDKNKMMSVADFIRVFDFVVKSSDTIKIPEMTFLHKDGFLT